MYRSNSVSQKETGSQRFPPNYMLMCQGGVYDKSMSQHFPTCFNVGTFSFTQCVGLS